MRKRPNHKPTDSYFYLAIQLDRCMMRDDALNLDIDPVITEITGKQYIPISHVCSNNNRKSKEFLEGKTYCRSILRTRANHKVLSSMKVLQRIAKQKAFTKA